MKALAVAAALLAAAAGRTLAGTFSAACASDVQRLCPTLTGGAALACLLRQKSATSNGCWDVIGELEPCASDIDRRCGEAEPGGGHILRCLESQRRDLSRPCSQALDAAEATMRRHGYQPPGG